MTMPTPVRGRRATRPRWFSTAAAAVLALLLIFPAAAAAHPSLVQSSPLGGLATSTVPSEIRLAMTEDVIPRGSSIEVRRIGSAPEGRIVRATPLQAGSSGLALKLPKLSPAVYEVRWVALGSDGHTTGGSFRFGVDGKGGSPPPGAERLAGPGSTATGGRGDETSDSDGLFATVVRWLGLLGVAVLVGGALLRRLERRAGHTPTAAARLAADTRWRRIAALSLALALFGAAEAVAVLATAGIGDPSLSLLTGNGNGRVALGRLILVAVVGIPALRVAAWRRKGGELPRADTLLLAAGVIGIVGYGIDGHVQGGRGSSFFPMIIGALHGLSAGVWLGGLIALVLLGGDRVRAFRAYAPAAVAATGVLAVTGTIAALREVDGWYFLRWSDYGRLLVIKILLAASAVALGGLTYRRLKGVDAGAALPNRSRIVLRVEAGLAILVVAAASILAGLVPGQGQPTAAQRGNILGGPALATAASGGELLRVSVAPAQPGANRISIIPTGLGEGPAKTRVRRLDVELKCGCTTATVRATLRKGHGEAWSAAVRLPAAGTWFAYSRVAGQQPATPVALSVGDTVKGGPKPRLAVQTADLSGRDARRCRAQAQGLALSIGKLNASGGLDGHRKLVLRTVDDEGSATRAAAIVAQGRKDGAVALAAPCGSGAGGAIRAAGNLPTVVADPGAPVGGGRNTYRLAGDPRDEGLALGQYVADQGFRIRTDAPRRLSVIRYGGAVGYDDLSAGLKEGLKGTGVKIDVVNRPDQAAFRRATRSDRVVSSVVSGDPVPLAKRINGLGGATTSTILAPGVLFDERFIVDSGTAGLQGTVASPGTVRINSKDGEAYANVVPLLFSGERPTIAGLQGYTAGLTLNEAFRDGSDPKKVEARLDRPRAYTDAITGPWLDDARTRGAPFFTIVQPTFLPENLIPAGTGISGSSTVSGRYFPGGSWSPLEGAVYGAKVPGGPVLGAAKTPLIGGPNAPAGPPGGTPIPGTGGVKAP